jgi:hypothetical protein
MRSTALAIASMVLLAACDDPAGDPSTEPVVNPEPRAVAGTFHVVSRFEVPATAAIPGPLGDALRLVHGLSTNPAGSLLDVAEGAGVPALDTLRLVLPASLESELEGWMNAYLEVATIDGVPVHDEVVALDALIRSVLLAWELRSELALPAPSAGTHAPTALAFHVLAEPVVIPVDATAPVTAGTGVYGTVAWPDGAGGPARVALSDHAMGIPFGRYALAALHVVYEARYGAEDLRAALGVLVDCAGMASSVGARCLGPLCVGHEAELEAICDAGLEAMAAQVKERILELNYDAIHFESGAAIAEDVSVDADAGIATAARMAGGVWAATVDLGQGAEEASATFTAAR